MIRVSLPRASHGDRLAKPVLDTDGKMLLNSEVELNEDYLARLRVRPLSDNGGPALLGLDPAGDGGAAIKEVV